MATAACATETRDSRNPVKNGQSAEDESRNSYKKWGFDLFPERRGDKYQPSWARVAFLGEGKENIDRFKCERKVYSCLQTSALVKLMMSALKNAGCEVDIRRHIACEVCDKTVSGGYDPEMNQVVVCQNRATSEDAVRGVLAHEFVHMFDYCRAKLDFKNLEHLACTEIRAANLIHCSFLNAVVDGTASPFRIAKQHAECVKNKAVASVLAVRKVSIQEAKEVVDKVFDKCYNDLEPIGRRIRRNSHDMEKAYQERYHYGYGE